MKLTNVGRIIMGSPNVGPTFQSVTIVALCLPIALTTIGGWAWGGIEGSKHDLSSEAWSDGDICAVCHSPHREKAPTAAPLWDPNADLSRTFGTSLARSEGAGPGTLVCLRCHDGTIAKDTIPAAKRKRFANKQHPGLFAAGQGATDHPVGLDYPQFARGFRPAVSVIATGTVVLPEGKVECMSCHDPHNQSGLEFMLVASNTRSALCLTCHKK